MDIVVPINLLFCGQIGKDELAAAGTDLSCSLSTVCNAESKYVSI